MTPQHIFLSYSRKDSDVMRHVCADLRAAGLTVWTDETLQPGTPSWQIEIENALGNASAMVVILSPDARLSEWVGREIQYAETQNKRIFPVLARGDEREAVPIALIGTQRVNVSADYNAGIRELIAALRTYIQPTDVQTQHHPSIQSVAAGMELNPFNLFDHLMLLWWLLFQPKALAAHGLRASDTPVRQTGAWLSSSFVWLPFLAPALGVVIGTVQLSTATPELALALLLAGLLGLAAWLVTGWLGWRDDPRLGLALMLIIGVFAFLLFTLAAEWGGARFTAGGGATAGAFLLTIGVSIAIAAGIAFRLATTTSGALAGILIAGIAYMTLSQTRIGVGGGLIGLVTVVVTFLVSLSIEQHFATGKRSWLSILVSLIVIANTAGMIWLYFLGGWQVLRG